MRTLLLVICFIALLQKCFAPPPRRQESLEKNQDKKEDTEFAELGIEYERYLKEVIDVLESDPEFKRKLEAAEETDIRTGKIAHELEFVDHNVRSKLDEVKRAELERLRHLAQKEFELKNGIDVDHMKIKPPEHLDHDNPHTFEIDDLKKLIAKVTQDLNEADKKRREEFKEYEMQKEFENQEKLKHLEGAEKEAFEKQLKDNETKHKQHEPLHHPGSKQQLEEVWEKQDHMQQEFDPKVFFQLHDLDGNGYWDQNEVKALFIKELDKMYQAGAPEDDMRERAEELERMREHVFHEADKNGDQLISYQEFIDQTKQPDFQKNTAWETVDQQPVYTHDEYLEFERRRQQEIQHMIQQGLIPPQPVYHMPQGYPQVQQHFPQGHNPQQFQHQPQYQHHPEQFHPGQQFHPENQKVYSGQQQYYPNQPIDPGQHQQQFHPGQQYHPVPPQQQINPGQLKQQQFHPGQAQENRPQMQLAEQAVPPQYHPNAQQNIQGVGFSNQSHPVPPAPNQHNVPPQSQNSVNSIPRSNEQEQNAPNSIPSQGSPPKNPPPVQNSHPNSLGGGSHKADGRPLH